MRCVICGNQLVHGHLLTCSKHCAERYRALLVAEAEPSVVSDDEYQRMKAICAHVKPSGKWQYKKRHA